MKFCPSCKESKSPDLFYRDKGRGDGRDVYCKVCANIKRTAKRNANREKYKAYRREFSRRPESREKKRAYTHKKKESRVKRPARNNTWGIRNRFQRRCHDKVAYAVTSGVLSIPEGCERCQSRAKVVAHHDDYRKPLDVMWLCRDCHGIRHGEINDMVRSGHDLTARGFPCQK